MPNESETERYEERYCGFVDVLGFSELIATIRTAETAERQIEKADEVRQMLEIVHSPPRVNAWRDIYSQTEFRAQSISDAVALSTKATASGLLTLFDSLETLAVKLLAKGFFIRGAIVRGGLYHDNDMVFGEALVSAYRLESTVARFPRVMVSSQVANDLEYYYENRANAPPESDLSFFDRVLQSTDGPKFLNVLRNVALRFTDGPSHSIARDKALPLQEKIMSRFNDAFDDPLRFEKVHWFARYWNDRVATFNGELFIPGPGLHLGAPY